MKKSLIAYEAILSAVPAVVFAANFTKTKTFLSDFQGIINSLTILAVAAALLFFFWGVAKFIWRLGGGDDPVADGKRLMMWGLIALFVIVTVWGIVALIRTELGIPQGSAPF